ncbi:MAG: hypothetical protein QOF03_1292 [Alphaproteobacteria bacterium]|jgi:TolB-like protein|nr:hypothetical protein [Alphaproteobacteria bacterium]
MSEDIGRANPKPPSVDRLSQLWRRINDHKMVQWGVAYVALAYAIQHAVILTSESFDWPRAVARVSMLLLALGLPVVMTFAWYHGIRASRRISGPELTIISILLVIGSLFFYVFVQPSETASAVQRTGVAAARNASLNPGGAISIAVMPFANLSTDKAQEFFSDGMTDEIAGALAKVPDLRVVARSSAFEFKGQNKEARAIGQALGATHLIEGSVRQAGTRVRITAQLIRADNGLQIWSDNYDRDLTDIFAIQEDIARAITTSLRMPLGLKPGENLVNNRSIDPQSYQQYLKAKALLRARSLDEAIAVLEPLVAHDPNFAPAWAILADSYTLVFAYNYGSTISGSLEEQRRVFQTSLDKRDMAARQAIRLDPKLPGGYEALAYVEGNRARLAAAEDLFRQALALDPNDPEVLDGYSQWIVTVGRLKDALLLREQLRALEPFVPVYNSVTAEYLRMNGQNDTAITLLKAINPGGPAVGFIRNRELANAYARAGRYGEAADTLLAIPANQNRASRRSVEDAARLLRGAPAKVSAPEALPAFLDEMNFVYAYVGAPNRVLEFPEHLQEIGAGGAVGFTGLWAPQNAPVRKTDRFKVLARKTGLVEYWRARGWPDLCHATTADDFACD